MRIILLGYGKMGRVIERIAQQRGHEIVARIDESSRSDFQGYGPQNADMVIEFSHPEAAVPNLLACFEQGLPVVCGTTGWLDRRADVEARCRQVGGGFFYASNYSIGVNLFFRLNQTLARLMNAHPQYEVSMTEIHHVHKLDAPSGTAITLAEGIIGAVGRLSKWSLDSAASPDELPIFARREDEVPGTHIVRYQSEVDQIEISHVAHNRDGFALGAVVAAEWLAGRQGIYGMDDLLTD